MEISKPVLIILAALMIYSCGQESSLPAASRQEGAVSVKSDAPAATKVKMPKQMRHCTPCHSIKKGEKHKIGPNLYGVVGREAGSMPGYEYSREYLDGKWLWTRENLDLLINKKYGTLSEAVKKLTGNPDARTKMKFYGAEDEDARKILDYLETLR